MTKNDCNIAKLTDRGVLRLSGPEAKGFLQGLITNDMDRVGKDAAVHAGLLTPQGKILFDFFVVGQAPEFFLECAKPLAGELAKRLSFYKLRAAIDIKDATGTHAVWAGWGEAPAFEPSAIAYADPRLEALGFRLITPAQSALPAPGCTQKPEFDYHAHRIALGVPEGGKDYQFSDAFPHEADFDQLNGIDFKKGCYVGQEVVSRMQHRGTARKRVVPVEGEAALSGESLDVMASGATIGQLGSVSDKAGLALLRLDRAEKAIDKGEPITVGGVPIQLRQPAWASFEVPKAQGRP